MFSEQELRAPKVSSVVTVVGHLYHLWGPVMSEETEMERATERERERERKSTEEQGIDKEKCESH